MKKLRKLRIIVALAAIWLATTAGYCSLPEWGGPEPPEGAYYTSYTPYHWQWSPWFCVPATVLMWHDKIHGPNPAITQATIWDWAAANNPGQTFPWPGGGMTIPAAESAAKHFINPNASRAYYTPFQAHQAMADFDNGVKYNKPTIVFVNNDTHAVLFIGTSWSKMADPIQRPFMETVTVHDPLSGYNPGTGQSGGANVVLSVGHFMNFVIANYYCGGCVQAIGNSGMYFSGTAALQGFDLDGGRYLGSTPPSPTGRYMRDGNGACYWEPNDSGANQCAVPPPPSGRYKWAEETGCYLDLYDSGPDQCSPEPPPTGRWKDGGPEGCYWEPNDSGPDQCTP